MANETPKTKAEIEAIKKAKDKIVKSKKIVKK